LRESLSHYFPSPLAGESSHSFPSPLAGEGEALASGEGYNNKDANLTLTKRERKIALY